ncbi:MAG TPA: sigma-70 family RNA polymerase sigma factor [Ktedonobacteraceae bacterium]|nr:sigma-70 family RNA polymerase sigma factor [Ktedonobacteraceae bacterium]
MSIKAQSVVDERQIVRSIAAGDREALAELYCNYQRTLFKYLLQLTPDYGLAEEILQDTLVAVWKSAYRFEGRSSLKTWLIGIARRQAHNTLRQRRLPLSDETQLEGLVAKDPEPEAFTLASFASDELAAAFRELAPLHREVLVLVFVQELSYQEVASILETPVGTVKSRICNARRALRALLDSREAANKKLALLV